MLFNPQIRYKCECRDFFVLILCLFAMCYSQLFKCDLFSLKKCPSCFIVTVLCFCLMLLALRSDCVSVWLEPKTIEEIKVLIRIYSIFLVPYMFAYNK